MNLLPYKKPLVKAIRFTWVTLSLLTVTSAGYLLYQHFKREDVVIAAPTVSELKGEVRINIDKIAYGEALQIGKVIGYENPEFIYEYIYDESPDFIKQQNGDGMIKRGLKDTGKAFFGKVYTVNLSSRIMFGYNLINMKPTDFIYNDETKILTIYTPELELIFIPNFKETQFDSSTGIFRFDFTEEDRKLIYEDAINQGESIVLNTTEEIEKGHEMTDTFIEDTLKMIPTINEHVKEINFVHKKTVNLSTKK